MSGYMNNTIKLDSWKAVRDYIDAGFYRPRVSTFEHIVQHGSYYPSHAYSSGQLASKSWLLGELHNIDLFTLPLTDDPIVAILGSWIGTLVDPMLTSLNIERIYGLDMDSESIEKSERLNQRWVQDNWQYKGVVTDVEMLDCSNMEFETGGELIQTRPDWIINTSCEHMSTGWFDTVDDDQLIIMQTNNSENFEGHINCCESIEVMQQRYPLGTTYYVGEMITPAYTRFMQIGKKK